MTAASRKRNHFSLTPSGEAWDVVSGSTPRKSGLCEPGWCCGRAISSTSCARKGTKEHEAILATDAVPHLIHAGLLLTGAEPGHPVQFVPKFEPPTGATIAIELRWLQDGKVQTPDARQWVKDEKKTPLARDWVFAGSQLYDDPTTKKQGYAADEGDLITVANFGSAILDLPIASSANDADRVFITNTEQIPPLGTEVFVALGPRPAKPGAQTIHGGEEKCMEIWPASPLTEPTRGKHAVRLDPPEPSINPFEAHTRHQSDETAHPAGRFFHLRPFVLRPHQEPGPIAVDPPPRPTSNPGPSPDRSKLHTPPQGN